MKISHTELNDILQKTFEGLRYARGDYEDLARAISWLEFRNWPILENALFEAQILQLKQPKISFEDSHSATISVEKSIAFMASALAPNLAYVKSKALGGTAVEIALLNPILPALLIPSLPLIAQRGFEARVVWHQSRTEIYHACIHQHVLHPEINIYSGEDLPINKAVFLEVGSAVTTYSPPLGITHVQKHHPYELNNTFTENLANGLEISDAAWKEMVKLSKNVLVEATDESRNKGAGENA